MNFKQISFHVAELAKQCGRDPAEIGIVAVTKGRTLEEVKKLYSEGFRLFGESRLQEALPKMDAAPEGIEWHLIGTLQKNKVKKALPHFRLIHSVDTVELAEKISEESRELGLETHILLQVNTSNEATKHGLSVEEWRKSFDALSALPALSIDGLMTIGPRTADEGAILRSFATLRRFKEELRLTHLSMGMSNDYPLAIREGATLLRIGTILMVS